jgi:hypothetical protein
VPPLEIHQRHLTPATLIGVAGDATARDERRADRGVHAPAMGALDPDLMQHGHCFSLIPAGHRV